MSSPSYERNAPPPFTDLDTTYPRCHVESGSAPNPGRPPRVHAVLLGVHAAAPPDPFHATPRHFAALGAASATLAPMGFLLGESDLDVWIVWALTFPLVGAWAGAVFGAAARAIELRVQATWLHRWVTGGFVGGAAFFGFGLAVWGAMRNASHVSEGGPAVRTVVVGATIGLFVGAALRRSQLVAAGWRWVLPIAAWHGAAIATLLHGFVQEADHSLLWMIETMAQYGLITGVIGGAHFAWIWLSYAPRVRARRPLRALLIVAALGALALPLAAIPLGALTGVAGLMFLGTGGARTWRRRSALLAAASPTHASTMLPHAARDLSALIVGAALIMPIPVVAVDPSLFPILVPYWMTVPLVGLVVGRVTAAALVGLDGARYDGTLVGPVLRGAGAGLLAGAVTGGVSFIGVSESAARNPGEIMIAALLGVSIGALLGTTLQSSRWAKRSGTSGTGCAAFGGLAGLALAGLLASAVVAGGGDTAFHPQAPALGTGLGAFALCSIFGWMWPLYLQRANAGRPTGGLVLLIAALAPLEASLGIILVPLYALAALSSGGVVAAREIGTQLGVIPAEAPASAEELDGALSVSAPTDDGGLSFAPEAGGLDSPKPE